MNPKAANLGSRSARTTGENPYGQRADGDFVSIKDEDGFEFDVQWKHKRCANPGCGEVDCCFRSDNGFVVCSKCATVQNDGMPDGGKSNRAIKRELEDFKAGMVLNER